jgi:hypothetical protein
LWLVILVSLRMHLDAKRTHVTDQTNSAEARCRLSMGLIRHAQQLHFAVIARRIQATLRALGISIGRHFFARRKPVLSINWNNKAAVECWYGFGATCAVVSADDGVGLGSSPVHRHARLGGTLNFYWRKAA